MSSTPEPVEASGLRKPTLRTWRHPAVLAAAGLSVASGFAQFAPLTALGDVARAFGEVTGGTSVAERAGLSGTVLGIGLAVIRLSSLASLPLSAAADAVGRKAILLAACALGLGLTVLAAAAPGYWWFVAAFALARPLLSATNAVAGVIAAEETSSAHRAKALALVAAGYGLGAGLPAVLRGVFGGALGYQTLFLLAGVALVLVPLAARALEEPERFEVTHTEAARGRIRARLPVLGVFEGYLRLRLAILAAVTFALAFGTGPLNSYLFVYAENVLGLAPQVIAAVAVLAAPIGVTGLLLGRFCADRLGRRLTAGGTQALVAIGIAATYSGSEVGAVVGYLTGVLGASAFAPAASALGAELFPTSVRATAAGWVTVAGVLGAVSGLLVFGVSADVLDGFADAALVVAVPVVLSALLFFRLPETRGLELEETAPE
jgi:MFS family permease